MASSTDHQDRVALAEIELCGELMIAASAVGEERLSPARIDEVLKVDRRGADRGSADRAGADRKSRAPRRIPVQGKRHLN